MCIKTLTAHDKYFLINKDNLTQPIQMHLSQQQKISRNIQIHFSNLH